MMTLSSLRRLSVRTQYVCAVMFLGLSIQLLTLHVADVRAMRDIGLPAALLLPSIEHRLTVLKDQADAAELQASVAGDATKDMLTMYVLPKDTGLDRLLATIDTLTSSMKRDGSLTALSAVDVGDERHIVLSGATVTAIPVTFEADVNGKGLQSLSLFEKLAGSLTISDMLSPEEQSLLLRLTEEENPAAITALEAFLATDLLTYAAHPSEEENTLLKSFSDDTFVQSLHTITNGSRLQDATTFLSGPMGSALQAQKLWPLRFVLPVKSAIRETGEDRYHVMVEWDVYGR